MKVTSFCRLLHVLRAISANGSEKPNIVFVLLDDMGWSNVGFHNEHVMSTPFLDKMARSEKAIELTNVYTTHRCSPSRAALLTGVYPFRYGLGADPLKVMFNPLGLTRNLTLLPELLQRENYTTHMVGKWHLGHASEDQLPHHRGFDSFYGFYEAQTDYFTHTSRGKVHVYRDQNGPVDKTGVYMTTDLNDQAKRILENSTNDTKPTFIYLPFQAPHHPLSAPKSIKDKLRYIYEENGEKVTEKMLDFHGAMKVIDNSVKTLYETAMNLDRETIFVFTSDNGAAVNTGGCNYPYKGGKDKLSEGGIKAPTLVMSTKRAFDRRRDDRLIHVTDWLPTLLNLAGARNNLTSNGQFPLDGRDFSRTLDSSAKETTRPRSRFIVGVKHKFNGRDWHMDYCVRFGDYKFCNFYRDDRVPFCDVMPAGLWLPAVSRNNFTTDSYIELLQEKASTKPGVRWRHHPRYSPNHVSLYNLAKDPFELTNLAPRDYHSSRYNLTIGIIRSWAEKEIGLPVLPVTGATTNAYRSLVSLVAWSTPYAKGRSRAEVLNHYMFESGRLEEVKMCNLQDKCSKKKFSKTNWATSAIDHDWLLVDEAVKSSSSLKERQRRKEMLKMTLQCGGLCCNWRLKQHLPCVLNYSSSPFK